VIHTLGRPKQAKYDHSPMAVAWDAKVRVRVILSCNEESDPAYTKGQTAFMSGPT